MPTPSLKARALLLCLTLWLSAAVAANAGGQPEARLADVERLVEQREYAAALKLLATIQRNDPNLRDQTSRLMTQIMAVTQQYNLVLGDLNKAIEGSDVEQMRRLISELHRIDPARAAGLEGQTVILLGLLKLMNAAEDLLREGKTIEAIAMYLQPFGQPTAAGVMLPASQFEAAGHGEIMTSSVKKAVAAIVTAAQDQLKAAPGLPSVLPSARLLVAQPSTGGGTVQETAARFEAITAPLLQVANAEGRVRSGASSLSEIGRSIQQSSENGREDLYLRYVLWLSLGREDRAEGIAHAAGLLWATEAQEIADSADAAVTAAFQSGRAAYESGTLDAADVAFQGVPARSVLAAKASALLSARFRVGAGSGWKFSDQDTSVLKDWLGRALAVQEHSAEAEAYRLLIAYRKDLDAMPAAPAAFPASAGTPAGLSAESTRLAAARASLERRIGEARSQVVLWTGRGASWQSKVSVVEETAPLAESAIHVAGLFRAFADSELTSRDIAYALRIAAIGGAGFPGRLDAAVLQRVRAEDLKDGAVNGQIPSGTGITEKHPDQALQVLATASGSLDSLVADVVAHEEKLQADTSYVKGSAGFAELFNGTAAPRGYNAILQTARSEKARIQALIASANTQVENAAIASREGDNNFAQAEAALKRRDPDGAESSLTLAIESYLKSLAEEYTDHASTRTTQDADDMNRRIVALQRDISVENAQTAVAAINRRIQAKDFLSASDALDAAVLAWNQNQENSYPPFDNLRLTIQAAVELSQGREISRLDAKADVVNAFIRNAQDNLAAGRLAVATQNVKDALAVAPNYGAAKVLQLMIKKQTDPAGFQRDAAAQIETYTKMGADRSNVDGQKTAYLALLDYSRLDPKFAAQTKGTVQELEYSLGLVRRPPTAQQITQSNSLVQQARATQAPGTTEAYQAALALLRQALQINPDNAAAARLDGEIRKNITPPALGALSRADTQSYNQAYSLFLSGAYQDAYDRVLAIWGDPRSPGNKTYGPLLRLKKRLEVQLNIS